MDATVYKIQHAAYVTYIGTNAHGAFQIECWGKQSGELVSREPLSQAAYVMLVNTGAFTADEAPFPLPAD